MWMESRCGAWSVDGGVVQFRIFLPSGTDPRIAGIRVAGTFQGALGGTDWDFDEGLALQRDDSDPRGTFWSVRTGPLPEGFYEYKYAVTFDDPSSTYRIVSDPCARYGGLADDNSAVVVGGTSAQDNTVPLVAGGRRPFTDLVVYELMIDDFTAEYRAGRAPLDAVVDRLDQVVALGFTAILFLPWTAWGDSGFNWGYEPGHYFALAPRYAHVADDPAEKLSRLKSLVRACHDRGLHVLMDGVFNHSGRAFPYPDLYLDRADCPFTAHPFGGDFGGSLIDLDFSQECTNEFVLDVCCYWIDTFGLDGIRFDAAAWYYVATDPTQGLPGLLTGLQAWLDGRGETNFSFMLEYLQLDAAQVVSTTAATSFWDNALHDTTFGGLLAGRLDPQLLNALNDRYWLSDPDAKAPTVYLSNHDHSQVGWAVARIDPDSGVTAQWWRLQPYLIALYTGTGVPLVPNGQEYGADHFVPENDNHTGRRVLSRPVQWHLALDPIGRSLAALHSRLGQLRNTRAELRGPQMHPPLSSGSNLSSDGLGVDTVNQLVVFRRGDPSTGRALVVLVNFSDGPGSVDLSGLADGEWVDLLTGPGGFGDPWSCRVSGGTVSIEISSHWGRILAPPG
jgi:1,4-alpha-glucan branching enzyme